MIIYLKNEEIDVKKWDQCIHHSLNGIAYAYSWYLNIVAPEWEALILDDYKAVFPLTQNKKYGLHYLFQPFFTQQLGIFSPNLLNEKIIRLLLNKIPSKYRYIDINLNTQNTLTDSKFFITKKVTHHLDLIADHQQIQVGYTTNLKRNIKKAKQANIQILKNGNPEALVKLFVNNQGRKIKGLKRKDYFKLTPIIYEATYKGMGETWAAYDQNNDLCAGIFFLKSHHKVISLIIASNSTAQKHGAIAFIFNSFIQAYQEKNLTLDFEGSMISGIARFYKSFGATEVIYQNIKLNSLPWYIKLIKQ